MDNYWIQIILIFALILANGFFASSEISLIALRKSRVKELIDSGNKKALLVQKLQSEPEKFLATVQIGVTLVGTLASVVGGAKIVYLLNPFIKELPFKFTQKWSESISIAIVVVCIAYLSLVIGELVPKYVALRNSEKVALRVAGPIRFLSSLSFILVKLLSFSTKALMRIFMGRMPKEPPFISEEEIKYIVTEGKNKGIFEKTEADIIHSVFEFTDTTVKKAMTPRTEIVGLEIGSNQNTILRTVTEEGYSRMPVYMENLDHIVGVIHAKDVINILQHSELIILVDIIRKPYFVPDSMKISELLREFQKRRAQMAIVLDEFGGTAGIITLEDVIEEIVGEIEDEYDEERKEVDVLPDGSAIVKGSIPLRELNEKLKLDLPEEKFETLNGLLINTLGRIPILDEKIELFDLNFTILEKEGHHLRKIKIIKKDV
ncbi:MAG: hemolysin family protein [candidate division Zixibacteria bacterium]|nr:hemolysin family protein [candidate division Zixibacteria bacterium]